MRMYRCASAANNEIKLEVKLKMQRWISTKIMLQSPCKYTMHLTNKVNKTVFFYKLAFKNWRTNLHKHVGISILLKPIVTNQTVSRPI